MKKRLSKEDKKRIRKEAREGGIGQMAERKPKASAIRIMCTKPYESVKRPKETMSVFDYLAKKRSDAVG